jgi:hypothetical protein
MSRTKFAAALGAAMVVSCLVTGSARGGIVTGNYTAGFDINRGYSEVSSISGANVGVAALAVGGGTGGPVDMFFETANNGGGQTHSYTLVVTNVATAPISSFRVQVGTSNLNWYLNANVDADASPDRLDPDMDNDGVANAVDNALWVANPLQSDLDGDQWGDVMDFKPTNASIPLAQVGGQALVPMTPTLLAFNFAPQIDFLNTPTSTAFTTSFVGPGDLLWTGGSIAPGATATFTFALNVRENMPNDGFVLRQIATVPEPSAAAGLLIAAAAASSARARMRR